MSEKGSISDALRACIASGHLIEVLDHLLDRLNALGAGNPRSEFGQFRRTAILHRSSLAHIARRRREGTHTPADDQQERRVTAGVLELIEAVDRRAGARPEWAVVPDHLTAQAGPPALADVISATDEDIFISYKRQDRRHVERLVDIVKAQGWSVFWDPQIVPGESNWDMLLERKLRAAKCVLVAWSEQAAASHYVRTEAHHGRSRDVLVAVTFDGTVPATFALSQTVNLSGWSGDADDARITDLLKGIAKLIAR
jgi:TIR domain